MSIIDQIAGRFSARDYLEKKVDRALIELCLESARLAPSACNKQPWYFVVVDDPVLKEKACKAAFDFPPQFNKFAFRAPVVVAVCAEVDFITHKVFGGVKNIQYYMLDIGAAVENFLLQASSLGFGSCWLGWFNEKKLKKALGIPKGVRVVSLVTLGYPAAQAKKKERKNLKDIYSYNAYRKP